MRIRKIVSTALSAAAFTLLAMSLSVGLHAEDAEVATTPVAAPEGLLPIPDYSGDLGSRSHLSGDWGGARTRLAEQGIQMDLEWTQTVQSVVGGGLDRGARYGGSVDLGMVFDLQRLGAVPGGLLHVRVESRYGDSINPRTGSVLPGNTDAFFPVTGQLDGNTLTISNFLYQQFLSETFGFFVGKFDNLESDFNEFASGRGTSQFMNGNFTFSPVTILSPYSSLGAFLFWAPSEKVFLWGGLYNTTDSSSSIGIDDFGDGASAFAEIYVQHSINDLPGGFMLAGVFDFDNEFVNLKSPLGSPPPVLAVQTEDTGWAAYANFWQYLWTAESAKNVLIDTQNHEVDLRGIGMFLRAGTADGDVNPVHWSVSGGFGGRGVIPSRPDDSFGIGYFYTKLRSNQFQNALGLSDDSQGFEVFYDMALLSSIRLTLDCQVLDSPVPGVDTAVVLGTRLNMSF